MISNLNLHVFGKAVNLQDYVWEIRYRIITKTILQEKVRIHYSTTIWFTNLFCMPQAVKIAAAKVAGGQGGGKIGENSGVGLDKSQK